jgi:hypothetical protein
MPAQVERLMDQAAIYQRLAVDGRLVDATLIGLRGTGHALNDDPELEFEFAVESGGVRRVIVHRQVVSRLAARELRIGSSIVLRVDPRDPSILVLA